MKGDMKTITIRVTADHIARGKRSDALYCPLALAAQDAGLTEPHVASCALYWGGGYGIVLPLFVQDFIGWFDRGDAVAPFEFDLDLPDAGGAQ